jgi:2-iminobutanoate/2-iminopropanoate deaminase
MTQTPPPVGPYTPVLRAGDWIVCSGQVGQVEGRLVDGGVAGQVAQAVANLAAVLHSQGADLSTVVKTTVFLTSMDDYAVMNGAYTAAFGTHRPARSAVAVAALPMGALVEIEAWAYVGSPSV